jgi:hypothetical protein
MAPLSSLRGTRRRQTRLGLQQPAYQLVEGVASDPPVRMVGRLGEERVGLGLLLKPIRFGFIPAPLIPSCIPPQQQWNQAQIPPGPW